MNSAQHEISCQVVTDRRVANEFLSNLPDGVLLTGYQHPDTLRAWLAQPSVEPVFVIFECATVGSVVLPLERRGEHTARFMGGRHANGNFPIGTPDALKAIASDGRRMLANCKALSDIGIYSLELERQHGEWMGIANPFIDNQSTTSPNVALSFALDSDVDALIRSRPGSKKVKKFRAQWRKLEAFGPVSHEIPVGPEQQSEVLDAFFAFKAERFASMGIHDVFSDAGSKGAFRAMLASGQPASETIHQLSCLRVGGVIASVMGCTIHAGRLTVEFSTFNPDFANGGPGDVLFHLAIEQAARDGLDIFDFGVGDENFKRSWCDVETWHRDTFVAISAKGQLNALAKHLRSQLVRTLKTNKTAWNVAKAARRKLAAWH